MKKLSLILLVVLCGCSTTVWFKEGATQQDLTTDTYECERDARQSFYFGAGLAAAINMREFQRRCMNARGWYEAGDRRLASPSASPPAPPASANPNSSAAFPPITSSGSR
jgi:hypothetical protein